MSENIDNPFFRCAFPEILWCCFGFANVIVSPGPPIASPIHPANLPYSYLTQ